MPLTWQKMEECSWKGMCCLIKGRGRGNPTEDGWMALVTADSEVFRTSHSANAAVVRFISVLDLDFKRSITPARVGCMGVGEDLER